MVCHEFGRCLTFAHLIFDLLEVCLQKTQRFFDPKRHLIPSRSELDEVVSKLAGQVVVSHDDTSPNVMIQSEEIPDF